MIIEDQAYHLKLFSLPNACIVVVLAFSLLAGCSPVKEYASLKVPTAIAPTRTALVAASTPVAATSPRPPEKMTIGRRYSFPNSSSNLIVINATTQTLFLSTFSLPAASSGEPVETVLIGMRYGRTYSFPDASFGTTYVLRDASDLVIAVYAVTSAPQQVFRVTNLSLVSARAAAPVAELKALRSFWSGTARQITLHFENSSTQTVLVNWVDFEGAEELKAALQKGQRKKFQSRYGHAWSVRTQSGQPVMTYYVTEAESQVVDITDEIIAAIQLNPVQEK